MSFSSRVIAESAPPVSAQIRNLGFMLWYLPIFISLFCLLISPRTGNALARANVHASSATDPLLHLPDLLEPEAFARVSLAAQEQPAIDNIDSGQSRFPLMAEIWKPSPFSAGKIALKADYDMTPVASRPRIPATAALAGLDIERVSRSDRQPEGEMQNFRRVKVIGATAIQADNLKIVLAGIEPLPQEATCRRLDGVMQSCIERAEHRLAILLQARSITCQLSRPLETGVHTGRCLADKIDIASDLLRHKLAQRPSSTLASREIR